MSEFLNFFDNIPARYEGRFSPESVLLSLLLAFVLGQSLAWVYYATHVGLSYSRSFVQSLILITVVVAMVMAVIGNNIVTAFGLMGALAIIRFRNIVKDTRDMAFIFCALVIGMAAGSQRFTIAITGAAVLMSIVLYLRIASFGAFHATNGFLRFDADESARGNDEITTTLRRYCTAFTLVSTQQAMTPDASEYSYELVIRDRADNANLVTAIQDITGVSNVQLSMHEELLEV